MRVDRAQILIGAEGTYGTDPTLAAATNALAVLDLDSIKHNVQQDSAEYSKEYLGDGDRWAVSSYMGASFALPLVGTGTPLGTPLPVPFKAALTACGLSIVETATTSVAIAPVSVNESSSAMYANLDGYLRKLLGVRGNVKVVLEEGKIGRWLFELMGLYGGAPSDTAISAGTFAALQAPAAFNKANTIVTLGGTALKCKRVELDFGRKHEYRNITGDEAVLNTDQVCAAKLTVEVPTVATKNMISEIVGATAQALSVVHGTVAGRIITFTAPRAIPASDPTESREHERLFLTYSLELRPTAANNALSILMT